MADGEINGLYPTPQRRSLLDLIAADPTRVYGEARQAWDRVDGAKKTARVKEILSHEWIEVIPKEEHRDGWSTERTYYRLTGLGERARMHGRETSRG